MKIVLCIEKLNVGKYTFKEGEAYFANNINENYWLVDTVGVKTEDFTLHFEIQEEVPSGNTKEHTETNTKKFVEEEEVFKELLKNFGGFTDEEEKPIKKTWWTRIKQWWDDWEIIVWYE